MAFPRCGGIRVRGRGWLEDLYMDLAPCEITSLPSASNVATSAIHRESNPSDEERQIVVVRSGSGERVINVEGPE
jgi:hypothetical protein